MTADAKRTSSVGFAPGRDWPIGVGLAALGLPTLWGLSQQIWTREDGAQGALLLAIGLWMLWREGPAMRAVGKSGSTVAAVATLLGAVALYVAGRILDYMTVEAGGLYLAGLALLYAEVGLGGLKRAWFPLVFLAFSVPAPEFVIDHLTAPLKHFAAFVSTSGLAAAGLPVAREGVTIMIAQYQLLVEDACSGMNSLSGLIAISLLYIYLLRRASPLYALVLACFAIPLAIAANILRIMALILITYAFGDEVGQSFIHMAAGLFLFTMALLLVFALDQALYPLAQRLGRK
jgi:exosortase